MLTHLTQNRLVLAGEIVETYEKEGKRIAKVALKSCHIDIPLDVLPDLHLGDTVALEADITIKKVNAYPQE